MVRSLIRLSFALMAAAFLSGGAARAQSAGEAEGNRMERKGNAEERAADAEKARGAQMEKQGKAEEKAGKKNGNKSEEMAGKRTKKKGEAIEKAGEAKGDEAKQMEKSGNKVEKAGVKSKKAREDAERSNALLSEQRLTTLRRSSEPGRQRVSERRAGSVSSLTL